MTRYPWILLATGVLVFALLVSPGDWHIERFTLVFVAPFAVVLGAAAGRALHRASSPTTPEDT